MAWKGSDPGGLWVVRLEHVRHGKGTNYQYSCQHIISRSYFLLVLSRFMMRSTITLTYAPSCVFFSFLTVASPEQQTLSLSLSPHFLICTDVLLRVCTSNYSFAYQFIAILRRLSSLFCRHVSLVPFQRFTGWAGGIRSIRRQVPVNIVLRSENGGDMGTNDENYYSMTIFPWSTPEGTITSSLHPLEC